SGSVAICRATCYLLLFLAGRPTTEGPIMGARRIRREQRQVDMAESRHRNGILKTNERARRARRIKEMLAKGSLPYTPPVMSWLSAGLGRPSKQIRGEAVKKVLAGAGPGSACLAACSGRAGDLK